MAPQYTISLYTSTGTLQAISQDYLNLVISRTVNAPDIAQIVYDSNSLVLNSLNMADIVTITRVDVDAGISASIEFSGIVRRITRIENDKTTFQVTAVGMLALLGDRIVAWPANVLNRSLFRASPAETILKTLFTYNIGASATTANGRLLDGRITGMTTSASGGTGTVMSIGVAGQNLLSAMQKIADDGGGDFSLSYTAPATWTFAWHLGQLGTDRTATVKLSVPLGTIGELSADTNRITDFTAVVVGGTGEGTARRYATRPSSLPTGLGLREVFLDARNEKKATTARLERVGQIALRRQSRMRVTYATTLLQNAALRYGRDYFIGDLVTILDRTTSVTQKVSEVGLEFTSEGQENVSVTLNNP
jgi:hypothetical protein